MRMLFCCVLLAALSMGVAAAQQPTQSVLTYHGALDRSGLFVVPGLTAERARSLHLDTAFDAKIEGRTQEPSLGGLARGSRRTD